MLIVSFFYLTLDWIPTDFRNDCWTPLPALPYPNSRFGLVEARGRMYAVGGFNGEHVLDSVVSFDHRMKYHPRSCERCGRGCVFACSTRTFG